MKTAIIIVLTSISSLVYGQWATETYFDNPIYDLAVHNNELFIVGAFSKRELSNSYGSASLYLNSFTNQPLPYAGTGFRQLAGAGFDLFATGFMTIGTSTNIGVYKKSGFGWATEGAFTKVHSAIFTLLNEVYVGSDFGVVSERISTNNYSAFPELEGSANYISAITKYKGELIVGGGFDSYNFNTINHIAQWDGSAWVPLGTGLNNAPACMAVYKGELYVGGIFTTAGGTSANGIAKWNGTSWSNVGGSITGNGTGGIRDMYVYNNYLFVAGDFDEIGNVSGNNVAYWDGYNWHSLDLQTPAEYASSITTYNNRLFVGTIDYTKAYLYSRSLDFLGDIEYETEITVSLMPNPVKDYMELDIIDEAITEGLVLEVVSTSGKLIYQQNISESNTRVNTADWASGFFFVTILNQKTGQVFLRQKAIKI